MTTVALWVLLIGLGLKTIQAFFWAFGSEKPSQRAAGALVGPVVAWVMYCLIRVLFLDGYTP